MRCDIHCPPPAGKFLARALAVLIAAAAARLVWLLVSSVAEALAVTILGLCAAGSVVTWRMVRYGSLRKPRVEREANRVTLHAELVREPYRIPAPPLAVAPPISAAAVSDPATAPEARERAPAVTEPDAQA